MTAKLNNFPIEGMGHFRSNFVCTFFGALNGLLDHLLKNADTRYLKIELDLKDYTAYYYIKTTITLC